MEVLMAINRVQAALAKEGISKDRKNSQQGYSFRGIDDMYNVLSPLLAANEIVVLPSYSERQVVEREGRNGGALFYTTLKGDFRFRSAKDGSEVQVTTYGEAMDSGDKATNKAMSAALKYAFMQTFTIPTEGDNDSENQTHEVRAVDRSEPRTYNPKKDAFERMPKDEQEFLRKIAADVIALLDEERNDDAYGFLRNQNLDVEEQVAIQHLFDSKQRSALAKAGEHYKAVQNAGAREQHRNSRPRGATPEERAPA